jgi:hypothetical protein
MIIDSVAVIHGRDELLVAAIDAATVAVHRIDNRGLGKHLSEPLDFGLT